MAMGQKQSLIALLGTVRLCFFPRMDQGAGKVMWYRRKYYAVEVSVEDADVKLSHFLMIYEP